MHFSIQNARSKRMVVSALLLVSLAVILLPLSADDERALVRSLVGSANVTRAGKTEALRVGSVIKDSDRIQTGRQSQVVVLYKGVEIRLRGETDATLVALTNTSQAASLKLDKGFGWFRVDDPTKRGFKVQTPTSVAAVRGTKFAVGYDENGSTSCVCQGKVATNAAGAVNETSVTVGGSHDYGKNGQFAAHDYSKYFKKLKVDRSFQQEIIRDAKLNNCKSCHQMVNIATDTSPEPQNY
ncbi:MAG: FecR family protein [Spirochaetia bacterium]|nr:FecR family protein [Spirochaetia bacterium]